MAVPPEIDADVLNRARLGDRDAHAALYEAFAPMVFTLARRMLGSAAQAEDILQDSFVEVIRNAAQYRGEAAVGSWIKRIAINKCLSHLRSPWVARRAFASGTDQDPGDARGFGSRERALDGHDRAGSAGRDSGTDPAMQIELLRALDGLSDTARIVVWLHDVEGYTHSEIGSLMGRSTSFSKSQLMRAYDQLRAVLVSEPQEKANTKPVEADEPRPTASVSPLSGESESCMTFKTV